MFVVYNKLSKAPVCHGEATSENGSTITLVWENEKMAKNRAYSLEMEYRAQFPNRQPEMYQWGVRAATAEEILIASRLGCIETNAEPTLFLPGQISA